jgi:hypothetical protein
MGLSESYGVLIGTKSCMKGTTPTIPAVCTTPISSSKQMRFSMIALGVDSAEEPDGHQWSILTLSPDDFAVFQLKDGWHRVGPTNTYPLRRQW